MQVTGDDVRRHLQQRTVTPCRLLQCFDTSKICQIADIGGRVEQTSGPYAEGVLEFPADRQDPGPACRGRHVFPCGEHVGKRRVASGPADHVGFPPVEVHDRVVSPDPDLPVMRENDVAETA